MFTFVKKALDLKRGLMTDLFNEISAYHVRCLENNILSYREGVKEEYCDIEEVISILGINKLELWKLVAQSQLTPCFLWDGLLSISIDMNFADYNEKFRKGTFNESSYLADRRLGYIHCPCYVNFRGYITPDLTESFVSNLIDDAPIKFPLSKIRLTANLTQKEKIILLGEEGQEREIEENLNFYKNQTYTIYRKSNVKEFDSKKCMFLKSQVIKFKEDIENVVEETTGKKKKISDKELFKLIIPTVIRYMRLKNHREKPNQMSGDKEGIKKDVLEYVTQDISLNFLVRNFSNNWQKVINSMDEGQSIIDKIFEEDIDVL